MNSGIALETVLDSSYLDTIVPSNLPPSELTVEIILPSWVTTIDGTSKITLQKTIEGTQATDISFTGTEPYNWEHEIKKDDEVICFCKPKLVRLLQRELRPCQRQFQRMECLLLRDVCPGC